MSKDELIEELKATYEGQEIVIESRRTMISDHWFVSRREYPGGPLHELGSDYTEVYALKNAFATIPANLARRDRN